MANWHALSSDQVFGRQACKKTAGLLTYVHKGLLYVPKGWDWRLCVVLMPEPGMYCLQRAVGTTPTCIVCFVLHAHTELQ